ncbi:MAG TPA: hypothetical protein PKD64_16390 [Pirellulaceae bacterium]|nr:hypothetical protein [Pirellulaceae bacterium]HMO93769.1 hypothetical protein [Pirellulaceae bacterium]HMP71341.1 hypothetical protein [Pirellulaceae bacterium]
MKIFKRYLIGSGLIATVTAIVAVGCSQPSAQTANQSSATVPATVSPRKSENLDEEHPHVPGAHGGIIIPIGADSYHAEAVVEKDGQLRLFMLGADETRIHEVDIQPVKAFVKASGETDAVPIEMNATPQDGDTPGKTSQFVGKLPETAIGLAIDVTIPNLRIGTERFRVGFTTAIQVHDTGMPAGVTGEEEQKLYFTAAGKYTEADIKANGNLTASAKFKGFMSKHDMNPKPGELICPVTFTKANPKIEWQVNGKKYLFCCPPCVDEFVRMAKEEPESVLEPEEYIQGERKPAKQEDSAVKETEAKSTGDIDPEIANALAQLSPEDRAVAESQKYCAVATSSALGSMGTPIKVEVNGEPVFLCCEGCRSKALRQPEETLATVAKLKQANSGKE